MIHWQKVKKDYITGEGSYQELAKKYGISYSTLKVHARKERWVEQRDLHQQASEVKAMENMKDRQSQDLARVDALADELLEKLQAAIGQLDFTVIQHKEKGENEDCKWEKTYEEAAPGGMVDRQGLRQLAACLKDLKQAKAIQSELERREQEARIEKLQQDVRENRAQEITVRLEEDLKAFSQ